MYFCSLFYVSGVLIEMKKDTIVGLMCVLWLLIGCGEDKSHKLRQLELLEQANRADSVMRNDSLAEDLVAYFDKNGTPNERMRAYYILGRTYFDLGELPRALETYLKAADCADTTDAECDYKTLSRVYAQKANVYYEQIQARSQLENLRIAERLARKGGDTLMAVECFSLQIDAYSLLKQTDSVFIITERAVKMFKEIGREDRSAQMLSGEILPLLEKGNLKKARECIDSYEAFSGFFDAKGNLSNGREIYYYYKGEYYLAEGKVDSAEYMFRKELHEGKDVNNQIAGCKGLQEVFERRKISDSIVKYAKIGYDLNDSAYSLSEMQNIQKFQASYNYNHNKYIAEQKKLETKILWLTLLLGSVIVVVIGASFMKRYFVYKQAALDYRLRNADITQRLHNMAQHNPIIIPSFSEWRELRLLVESEIPSFYETLNTDENRILSDLEYDVCLALRVQLSPVEISKLKQCTPSYITKIRKKLLTQIFDKVDSADVFDDEIANIRNNKMGKILSLNLVKSFFRYLFGRKINIT